MTLKEAVGVDAFCIDNETGKKVEHREFYSKVIELLGGLDVVKMFIPFSLIQIREALPKDKNLNNLPIDKWDRASGFHCKGSHCTFIGGGITNLYGKAKITAFSNSDGVCILKEAARQWAEREGVTYNEAQ